MSHPAFSATLLIAALSFTTAVPSQQPASSAQPANRITLDVVATQKSGAPVPGLHQQDFTVLDNGSPRPITAFQAVATPSAPIEVILLIDVVNTNLENISVERKQIDSFLLGNDGHLLFPTTLAIFTDKGTRMQQGFSTDGAALATALDQQIVGLNTIRQDSQWAAQERVQISLDALNTLARKEVARPGRKVILWVSPGWPLLSDAMVNLQDKQMKILYAQIANTSTLLRTAGITLYSIDSAGPGQDVQRANFYQTFLKGISKPSQVEIGDLGLQVLAVQTGGLVLGPGNDIAGLLQRCMADTTAYYELSFDPSPADHPLEYHSLQVKVAQPGLTARTRTNYYTQP